MTFLYRDFVSQAQIDAQYNPSLPLPDAAGNHAELRALPSANHFTAIHGFEETGSALCQWLARTLGVVPA
jgi:arylformamidase